MHVFFLMFVVEKNLKKQLLRTAVNKNQRSAIANSTLFCLVVTFATKLSTTQSCPDKVFQLKVEKKTGKIRAPKS